MLVVAVFSARVRILCCRPCQTLLCLDTKNLYRYSVRLHSLALTAMGVSASVMKAKEDEAAKAAEELTAAKQVSHDVDACPPSFPKQRFC